MVIHRPDGRIRNKDTYRNSPCRRILSTVAVGVLHLRSAFPPVSGLVPQNTDPEHRSEP